MQAARDPADEPPHATGSTITVRPRERERAAGADTASLYPIAIRLGGPLYGTGRLGLVVRRLRSGRAIGPAVVAAVGAALAREPARQVAQRADGAVALLRVELAVVVGVELREHHLAELGALGAVGARGAGISVGDAAEAERRDEGKGCELHGRLTRDRAKR